MKVEDALHILSSALFPVINSAAKSGRLLQDLRGFRPAQGIAASWLALADDLHDCVPQVQAPPAWVAS
jgi:hypothetical protein